MSQEAVREPLWMLVSDMFLRVKLEALARTSDLPCRGFTDAAALVRGLDAPGASPSLILVDLAARDDAGFALLETLGARATRPPTLAYFSHVDEAARQRAIALGATRVVPRSALVMRFAELVREVSAPA